MVGGGAVATTTLNHLKFDLNSNSNPCTYPSDSWASSPQESGSYGDHGTWEGSIIVVKSVGRDMGGWCVGDGGGGGRRC